MFALLRPHLEKLPLMYDAKSSIVAALLLCYFMKLLHFVFSVILLRRYDNVNASYKGGEKNKGWDSRLVQRTYNAHTNSFEAFLIFSIAIIFANLAPKNSLPKKELDLLANAFICCRMAYCFTYIIAFNAPMSMIRSALWFSGFIIIMQILTLSTIGV